MRGGHTNTQKHAQTGCVQMCAMCVMCGVKKHVVCGENMKIESNKARNNVRNNGTEFARREAYVATIGKYPDACGEYRVARLAIA